MNSIDRTDAAFEQRIVHALETSPRVVVADDFAAEVCNRLPLRSHLSMAQTRYGRNAMRLGLGVLLAALLALAAHGMMRTGFGVLIEWILCAEFAGLAVALGAGRRVLD